MRADVEVMISPHPVRLLIVDFVSFNHCFCDEEYSYQTSIFHQGYFVILDILREN